MMKYDIRVDGDDFSSHVTWCRMNCQGKISGYPALLYIKDRITKKGPRIEFELEEDAILFKLSRL